MTDLLDVLTDLREARGLAGDLADTAKGLEAPHKAAIQAATGRIRADLREAESLADALAAQAQALYMAAEQARRAACAAGAELPRVELPAWCSVRHLPTVVLDDPDQLPRLYLDPAHGRIKAALLAGGTVAGAHLEYAPSFACRQESDYI